MLNLRHHALVAWQRADDLFIKLHVLTIKQFPAFERFELGSQLRKAAYSVPANWLLSARSTASGYITGEALLEFEAELNGVGAPLSGLIRFGQTNGGRRTLVATFPPVPPVPPS